MFVALAGKNSVILRGSGGMVCCGRAAILSLRRFSLRNRFLKFYSTPMSRKKFWDMDSLRRG